MTEDPNSPAVTTEATSDPTKVSHVSSIELTTYSGPLPHPDILRQFEQLYPGAAKQIFEDFELESAHRRMIDSRLVRAETFGQILGSLSAALIGLVGVAGGLWLASQGLSLDGLAAIFGTLASLVGIYLHQNRR